MHDESCIWWDQENNVLGICDCSYTLFSRGGDYGDGYKDGFYRALNKVEARLTEELCMIDECYPCEGIYQSRLIVRNMILRLLGQEQE